LCSLLAGLKAYADTAMKRIKQSKDAAVVEPRSAGEQLLAAEATKCHKPRPVDGTQLSAYKVAHTRLPSVGFRSWSRLLAVSLQA